MPRAFFRQLLTKVCGSVLPVVLPPIHIAVLYQFWREFGRRVNRQYCSCSCWDTIFKGTYESGIASYKHVYFNATANTMKIWIVTVLSIILLYETSKHVVKLLIEKRARYIMCVLFASSLFAHYYTWWVYVNYWNDDFYEQWNHQLFFTITEVLSTVFVVHLVDTRHTITPRKVVVIVSIAVIHVLAGGLDQFLTNVILGEGLAHQILRDVSFMVPDVLHIALPLVELASTRRKEGSSLCDKSRDLPLMLGIILGGCALSYVL